MEFSTDHLDYLSRTFLDDLDGCYPREIQPDDVQDLALDEADFFVLRRLGRTWAPRRTPVPAGERTRHRSEDLLTGCHGAGEPVVFVVTGDEQGISVSIGVVPGGPPANGRAGSTLESMLAAQYPGSRFERDHGPATVDSVTRSTAGGTRIGLLTGLPTAKEPEETGDPTQLDRVLRAMSGQRWGLTVIAQPVVPRLLNGSLHQAIQEMRNVNNAELGQPRHSPLADAYLRRLEMLVHEFEAGAATGMWTTAAYLTAADQSAYDTLRSTLAGVYGGEQSFPDPIRVVDLAAPGAVRDQLGPLLVGSVAPPGNFEYPYSFQTLLSSTRLATLIHLPHQERPGYAVEDVHPFDVTASTAPSPTTIRLGTILDRGQPTGQHYVLDPQALNKHALVVGVTGSGKTNTAHCLLSQLWARGIPFLVIEPSKTEYRRLLNDPVVGGDLRVFTLGDEHGSPFRMNPFETEPGVSLATHVDLLKSVFNAAFSMWTVLPQILEQSLHRVYGDYGWSVVGNDNDRLGPDVAHRPEAFPTLGDLQTTIAAVVDRLGYEPNTTSELKAALLTRIQSLRIGGKGRMLDTRVSTPMEALLSGPTVLELEAIGDDDEKAFMMGILLTRIYEQLRVMGPSRALRHVVVVEEAHRLLGNVRRDRNPEVANTQGKAVETFVQMLSEVRAYGEGFIIAEQIPENLAPDILKNTNVKIVHRTVSSADRAQLAGTMNMTDEQADMLATLTVGEAAVFAEHDDRPILVAVDPHELPKEPPITPARLAQSGLRALPAGPTGGGSLAVPSAPSSEWDLARPIAESGGFQRFVGRFLLTLFEGPAALASQIDEALVEARRVQPGLSPSPAFHRALLAQGIDVHLRWLGQAYGWTFADTSALRDDTLAVALDALEREPDETIGDRVFAQRVERIAAEYRRLCRREFDPYEACTAICGACPAPCLYRHQASRLVEDPLAHRQLTACIESADDVSQLAHELFARGLAAADQFAGEQLPDEARRQAALCYTVQELNDRTDVQAPVRRRLGTDLIAVARDMTTEEAST